MEELIEYLKKQQTKWLRILNERYKTDGGTSLEEAAKGRLTAYTELLTWIENHNKQDENTTRETRGTGEKTQAHGGSPL
jgi:translation initiation factor 2 alpha subunit (eIF-2alpha)